MIKNMLDAKISKDVLFQASELSEKEFSEMLEEIEKERKN